MPKIISNTKGITLDKDGQPQVDNSNRRLTMEQMEKNTIILEWITKTKEYYLNNELHGMCSAFSKVILYSPDLEANLISILQKMDHPLYKFEGKIMYRNEWIPALIPEFNFDFLDGNRNTKAYESYERGDLPLRDIYWWEMDDRESRIKAFDKLIGIYEAKVNGRAL